MKIWHFFAKNLHSLITSEQNGPDKFRPLYLEGLDPGKPIAHNSFYKTRPDQNEAQIFLTFFILRLKIFLKNGDFLLFFV